MAAEALVLVSASVVVALIALLAAVSAMADAIQAEWTASRKTWAL